MTNRCCSVPCVVGSLAVAVVLVAWTGFFLLLFYVPGLVGAWEEAGHKLSSAEMYLIDLSLWARGGNSPDQNVPGAVFMGFFLLLFTCAVVGGIVCCRRRSC